jgi:hypothetical protein
VQITRADKVKPRVFKWVWGGRVRFGSLTIIAAERGSGASLLCADLAARASSGKGWPGEPDIKASPGIVQIYAGGQSKLSGRLIVKGAAMQMIKLSSRVFLSEIDKALVSDATSSLILFDDLVPVDDWATNDHGKSRLDTCLKSLAAYAKSKRNAVIAVVKLSSSDGIRGLELAHLNSKKYIESLIVLERDGERTAMRNHRNENAPRFSPLEFGVIQRKRNGCEALKATYRPWLEAQPAKRKTRRRLAEEFLQACAYQSMSSAELLNAAKAAGISRSTLHRARVKLGFDVSYHNDGGARRWSLKTPDNFEPRVERGKSTIDYCV